jgi:drug/metabolite transporter (DMT)-like permease
VDPLAFAERLPSGKEVFGDGSAAHRLPQLISIPSYLVLVGGAAWSAWRMRGRRDLRDRFVGTLLVAAGATITAAAGSTFAALGNLPAFSISLLAGVVVMFLGFLRATRVPRPADQIEPPADQIEPPSS